MIAHGVETTAIPGLLVIRLKVHADDRGWFKENWQRARMVASGLPDFGPVQHNVAFNERRGSTRGIHAEPWDKLVSLASGRAHGVWVDLRAGATFGTAVELELDPTVSVFVPQGVGNAYQTLEDATAYTYLVNDHWRADAAYVAVALDDPSLAIEWPIDLTSAEVSPKDRLNPTLAQVSPFSGRRPLILGAGGQVGSALTKEFPQALGVDRTRLDLADRKALEAWPWRDHDVILNAAGYTDVDAAETPSGRARAWAVNAAGPAHLARLASRHGCTLVHISSDYVFDGTVTRHNEDEPFTPLGVYGQTKAAGDLAVAAAPAHYILRTSWVVGEGHNFVRTMQRLAEREDLPRVVEDQIGRLTFADELARAVSHLLDVRAPAGTYNVSNSGPPMSWADIAAEVFRLHGRNDEPARVDTGGYLDGRSAAPRPPHSTLVLRKLRATGFEPADALPALRRYVAGV